MPEENAKKQNLLEKFVGLIGAIIGPAVMMFVVAGILKGVLTILTTVNLLSSDSGTYLILYSLADSIYYFLPILLAYTSAQKFGANVFSSLIVAATLIHPDITAAVDAGTSITFLGIPVYLVDFSSTLFPIMFAVALLAFLEKRFDKIFPEAIRGFFTPLFALVITVPVTFLVIGPITYYLSAGLTWVYNTFYNFAPWAAGVLMGAGWHVLMIFGLHLAMLPLILLNVATFGFDTICPMVGMSCVAQAGACFGVFLRSRNSETKGVATASTISGLLGTTETCVYGCNFIFRRPYYIAVVTGAVFGGFIGMIGTTSSSLVSPGIPTLPAFFGPTFGIYCAAYVVNFLVTAALVYFFGYKEDMDKISLSEKTA
ncbi:MAG: PTS transporter subunit EIIC [Lachnospiraceae bacterium]|nr:PTS transporter subunit EIIC [Lachnospiraceae bacterium]MCD8125589.1 PTS transporter subunit EIIC [Lachnospiraceae bacterium]